MNFSLAREIYGLNGWCVDSQSLPSLMSILKNIQSGVALEIPETKYNAVYCYDIKSKETRLISDTWELRNDNDFDGIGVINLNGVITKGGGASSYGTKDISRMMLRMSNDNRIKGFVLRVDSGGGASNAVGLLSDTINEVKKTKPVYTLVEKGGYMASAAYGIGSAGNGGNGIASSITGTSVTYAGGGGGGAGSAGGGFGGTGGGGNGGQRSSPNKGTNGLGGGGGGSYTDPSGFSGGSGIVIVRTPK